MSAPRTLALVETATQLLNVAEWAHATGAVDDVQVAVLLPRDRQSLRQIARVSELVGELGVHVRERAVRVARPVALISGGAVARELAGAQQLVLGDPFSRFIQTLLPLARADRVVVVDDGTATWEFVSCLNAGKPLVRWRVPRSGAEYRANRACAQLSPSVARRLTMFTCLHDATPVGATRLANSYSWSRSWRRPQIVDGQVDVLGISLADSGLIERRAYVDAIAQLARRHAPVRYIAHRRESESLLAEIATLPGVQVKRFDLPAELALRQGPVARRIVTFPSSVAHTLPIVLGDVDVRIDVRRIEPDWFTPSTTRHAREFVSRIAERAPMDPLLENA